MENILTERKNCFIYGAILLMMQNGCKRRLNGKHEKNTLQVNIN